MYGILSNSLCVTFEKSKVILVPVCDLVSFPLLAIWKAFSPSFLSFHNDVHLCGFTSTVLSTQWDLTICKST